MRALLVLAAPMLVLSACGKEAARVPLAAEGSGEVTAQLKQGDVAFWTDIDLEYEGDAVASYRIEVLQDGVRVAETTCDPLGYMTMKVSWRETNLGSSHSRRGSGKMGCAASLSKGGPTTIKATLAVQQKPATFVLKKADLVVKQ